MQFACHTASIIPGVAEEYVAPIGGIPLRLNALSDGGECPNLS